jgi:hypothetical protein
VDDAYNNVLIEENTSRLDSLDNFDNIGLAKTQSPEKHKLIECYRFAAHLYKGRRTISAMGINYRDNKWSTVLPFMVFSTL